MYTTRRRRRQNNNRISFLFALIGLADRVVQLVAYPPTRSTPTVYIESILFSDLIPEQHINKSERIIAHVKIEEKMSIKVRILMLMIFKDGKKQGLGEESTALFR